MRASILPSAAEHMSYKYLIEKFCLLFTTYFLFRAQLYYETARTSLAMRNNINEPMPTYEVPTNSDHDEPTFPRSSLHPTTEQTHPQENPSAMSQDHNNNDAHQRPRQILPEPEVFKGDTASYQNFKHLLKAKLYVDRHASGGPYECIWYADGQLSGNAASHILPWMISNVDSPTAVKDDTVTKLFERLDFNYMDKELQRKAMYNLSALKQGSKTINELLATFDRYLMEAGQQNQPDDMKIFWLENTSTMIYSTDLLTHPLVKCLASTVSNFRVSMIRTRSTNSALWNTDIPLIDEQPHPYSPLQQPLPRLPLPKATLWTGSLLSLVPETPNANRPAGSVGRRLNAESRMGAAFDVALLATKLSNAPFFLHNALPL